MGSQTQKKESVTDKKRCIHVYKIKHRQNIKHKLATRLLKNIINGQLHFFGFTQL